MKVLVACEFSGVVREAFRKKGHEAWSCDIINSPEDSYHHIKGDVKHYLNVGWDLMIAHPPCTYLCNSGVRWLHEQEGRWEKMKEACEFFDLLWNAPINKVCIENPIPHGYAKQSMGLYHQKIQPWQFGHGETKATCLWLKSLPKLKPTNIVEGREARIHKMSPGKDRGMKRSITYQGIADAMADQWSDL